MRAPRERAERDKFRMRGKGGFSIDEWINEWDLKFMGSGWRGGA